MAVRNFWIEGQVDGQTKKTLGGPMSKDGGFTLTVKMRELGGITTPLTIQGRVGADGHTLILMVDAEKGTTVVDDNFGVTLRRVTKR